MQNQTYESNFLFPRRMLFFHSARAAYLALDIDAAIADQTRAVSLFAGTEFLDEAKQTLAFYQAVKALKANP